jgi:hypothetical protein
MKIPSKSGNLNYYERKRDMNFLHNLLGKKESKPKPKVLSKEELASLIHELLTIDLTEGLMQVESGSSSNQLTERHKRGREIGQILCDTGGTRLMEQAGMEFVKLGGDEWNLVHCWHFIEDKDGITCWF